MRETHTHAVHGQAARPRLARRGVVAREIASGAVGQAGADLTVAERELLKVDTGSLSLKPRADEVPPMGGSA